MNLTPMYPDYLIKYVSRNFTSPFNHLWHHPVHSLPVITQRYRGAEQFYPSCPWIFQKCVDVSSSLAPIKRGYPLCRRLPDTPYAWRTSAELSLLFTELRVTPSLSPQHHGQHPDSPPCGYLLLRLPVARLCWGHLAGDALIRFHIEIPAGERPGEAAWKGHGVKCAHWSGCL